MKTRVLFVTDTFAYGGTEKALVDLIARLDLTKVEPIVLCFGLDVYTGILNKELGLCVSVDRAFKPAGLLRYWRLFKKFDPHVIMFVNGCLGLFPWYAYLDARLSGAPRVLAIEQLIADPAPPKVEEHGLINLIRRCA